MEGWELMTGDKIWAQDTDGKRHEIQRMEMINGDTI